MSKTVVRKNESLDDALRRFKRSVSKAGTLQESRKREFYEKPSVKQNSRWFFDGLIVCMPGLLLVFLLAATLSPPLRCLLPSRYRSTNICI